MIRTLVVDDEPLARRRIRRLLQPVGDVEIVGECGDGRSAVDAVHATRPDLVLLDVQMPEMDGFGVLQAIRAGAMPAIIFVTAHDRYAVRAFDVHALDYVLKPVDPDRLSVALARVRGRLAERRGAPPDRRLIELLQDLTADRRYVTRIPVRTDGRIVVVDLGDVDWIAAADNYVILHAGPKEFLVRDTLGKLERDLDPDRFVRIHRSTILAIDRIRELRPDFHGDFRVVLTTGASLTLSRTYRAKVEAALGRRL